MDYSELLVNDHILLPEEYIIPNNIPLKNTPVIPNISQEAYFGKHDFVLRVIRVFTNLRNILLPHVDSVINQNIRHSLQMEITEFEKICEEHFNVEECTIYIAPNFVYNSMPLYAGKIDYTEYEKLYGNKAKEEYSAYIIDSKGIRYKHKEGKFLVITIGVPYLVSKQLTPEHVAAIFLHEAGHAFSHYNFFGCNLEAQKAMHVIDYSITVLRFAIKLIDMYTIVKDNPHVKNSIDSFFKNKPSSNFKDPNLSKSIAIGNSIIFKVALVIPIAVNAIIANIKPIWSLVFRQANIYHDKVKKAKEQILDGTFITSGKDSQVLLNEVIVHQITVLWTTIAGLLLLQPLGYIKSIVSGTIFRPSIYMNLRKEHNADTISAAYGMGKYLAEAILLVRSLSGKDYFLTRGLLDYTDNIPVLNTVFQIPFLIIDTITTIAGGHPTDRARIKSVYNTLQKNIANPKLPPKLRKALQEDINELAAFYNRYIEPSNHTKEHNYALAICYYFGRFFIQLEKSKTSSDRSSPPSPITMFFTALKTWQDSFDIKKMLNMSSKDEVEFVQELEKQPQSILETPVTESACDALDSEIYSYSPLKESDYIRFNKITFESYYGQSPIAETVIARIHAIRALLPSKGKLSDTDKNLIKTILKTLNADITKEFNVEASCITIVNAYNAWAIPMFIGSHKEVHASDAHNITETSNGFKFKSSKDVIIIIGIGLGILCDRKLTDETCAGIIFHELGHGFQQYKNDNLIKHRTHAALANIMTNFKDLVYSIVSLRPINSAIALVRFICSPIQIITGIGLGRKTQKTKEIERMDKFLDSAEFTKDGAESDIKEIVNPVYTILSVFYNTLCEIISLLPIPGITSFALVLLKDPLYLVDIIVRGLYFKRRESDEYFADSFSVRYGFGEGMSVFMKNMYYKDDYNAVVFNDINNIPLLKAIRQFNYMGAFMMLLAVNDHPIWNDRIKNMQNEIEKEIAENTDLPENIKTKLKKEVSFMKGLYNEIIDTRCNMKHGKYGQALMWFIINLIFDLKKNAKTIEDFMKPIEVSIHEIIKSAVNSIQHDDRIKKVFGFHEEKISVDMFQEL